MLDADPGGGLVLAPVGLEVGLPGGSWTAGCLSVDADPCEPTARRVTNGVEEAWTLLDDRLWYRAVLAQAQVHRLPLFRGGDLTPDGDGYRVETGQGDVRVGAVGAWDAEGRPVPVRYVADADSLEIEVDGRGGKAPILVDPFVLPGDATIDFTGYNYGVFFRSINDYTLDGVDDLEVYVSYHRLFFGAPTGVAADSEVIFGGGASDTVIWRPSDLDGDGLSEFFVGCGGRTVVRVGIAGVLPGPYIDTPYPPGTSSYTHGCRMTVGDVDGNGNVDLIMAEHKGSFVPGFNIYEGGPSFTSWVPLASPPYVERSVSSNVETSTGDVNGDGFDDVLLVMARLDGVDVLTEGELYLGGPSGASGPAVWAIGDVAASLREVPLNAKVVDDVDGDGSADIALSGAFEGPWWVPGGAYGPGQPVSLGTWLPQCQGFYFCDSVYEVGLSGVGDLNGDGHHDLVIESGNGAAVVFGGPYGPVLPPYVVLDVSPGSGLLLANRVGDLNGDGYEELAIAAPMNNYRPGSIGYPGDPLLIWYGGPIDDIDQDGWSNAQDCEPYRHEAYPGSTETPGNPWDEDCDGTMLCFDGTDADADGAIGPHTVLLPWNAAGCVAAGAWAEAPDCDDADAAIGPTRIDLPDNDVDEDCDGLALCRADLDGDGFGGAVAGLYDVAGCSLLPTWDTDGADCDDTRADIFPGAPEVAGIEHDEDCDERALCFVDADGDGYGSDAGFVPSPDATCDHAGISALASDCEDGDSGIHPGAAEFVDLIDNDCDGSFKCYFDHDNDGYAGWWTLAAHPCGEAGSPDDVATSLVQDDCNDTNFHTHPGALEYGYSGDMDCDGLESCTEDADADGCAAIFGPATFAVDCPSVYTCINDCNDQDPAFRWGAAEAFGGPDFDCNRQVACFADDDLDGFGSTEQRIFLATDVCSLVPGAALTNTDCDPANAAVFPGAPEVAGDRVDDDCDNRLTCHRDLDRDGYGSASVVTRRVNRCDDPSSGLADNEGDCDDAVSTTRPGVLDRGADGLDANCDGVDGLRFTVDATTRTLALDLRGAGVGARVTLAVSTVGPGAGPCPPALGGTCLGLRAPRVVGTWTANAQGRVSASLQVPAAVPPGTSTAWQALVTSVAPAEASAVVLATLP